MSKNQTMKNIFSLSAVSLFLLLNSLSDCSGESNLSEECKGQVKYASESNWISEISNARYLTEPKVDSTYVILSVKSYSSSKGEYYYNFSYQQKVSGKKHSRLYECGGSYLGSDTTEMPSPNMSQLFELTYTGVVQL